MSHAAIRQLKTHEGDPGETVMLIGETSRKVIARMREIIWSLHSAHDSVGHFSFRVKETTYALLEHHPIEIHLDISDDDIDMQIATDHRRNLFLVFKEILHNIIRHAKARNIYIQLFIKDNYLNLVVRDDGVGFVYKEHNSGNGLINLKQRTSVFAGVLTIKTQPDQGTLIQVLCPIASAIPT